MSSTEPTPDQLVEEAERILGRDEFQPPEETLLERALDWFGERVTDVLEALAGRGVESVLAWAALAALVGLVVWLLSRLGGGTWRRPARHRPDVVVSAVPPPVSGDEWRRRAVRAEAAGETAEAVRCLWRARVADLAADGVVAERPSATAGEYRRAAAGHDEEVARRFELSTDAFEEVWFGGEPAGQRALDVVRSDR